MIPAVHKDKLCVLSRSFQAARCHTHQRLYCTDCISNFCMADGSVRSLNKNVDLVNVLQPLSTRSGGEVINASQY